MTVDDVATADVQGLAPEGRREFDGLASSRGGIDGGNDGVLGQHSL